jgi:hypothetical protein
LTVSAHSLPTAGVHILVKDSTELVARNDFLPLVKIFLVVELPL